MDEVQLTVPAEAVARLRTVFIAVEGSCEAWPDDEVVRRMLIRGAMDYAKNAGQSWEETTALARDLRGLLGGDQD